MSNSKDNITVERLSLTPEWVENPGPESGDLLTPSILFFLGGFIILLYLGEGLGELLVTILTVWISLFVIFTAIKKTRTLSPWKRTKNVSKKQNLPLKRTSDTTERALKGFELSQMLIEKRLKKDFIEKIKEAEGLSEKEMRQLIERPSKLKKVINDEELYKFVMNSKTIKDLIQRDTESNFSKFINLFTASKDARKKNIRDTNFEKRMREIIKKISDWENG